MVRLAVGQASLVAALPTIFGGSQRLERIAARVDRVPIETLSQRFEALLRHLRPPSAPAPRAGLAVPFWTAGVALVGSVAWKGGGPPLGLSAVLRSRRWRMRCRTP